jgi:hypothetical protein
LFKDGFDRAIARNVPAGFGKYAPGLNFEKISADFLNKNAFLAG